MKIILVLFAVFTFDLTGASSALAWGERGHHLICQVATRLVKEEKIKTFLETRGDIMGHALLQKLVMRHTFLTLRMQGLHQTKFRQIFQNILII
jgi:hypothetical protein